METGGAALRLEAVSKAFAGHLAVRELSLQVPRGSVFGLLGPNGAGKTTTLRMVMDVLAPDSGTITVLGQPAGANARDRIGYMPEERGLYPKQKVLDQLGYLGELSGMSREAARTEAMSYLERFGLGERAGEKVEKLSLGNQQRVQIVAALMNQPAALILDEPFSGLDPTAVDAMAQLLREHVDRGIPLLFSSHQLELVERLCDHLVVLSRGRVVADGTTEELRHSGPVRYRIVLGGDAGWVRDVRGVRVHEGDGQSAVVEFDSDPEASAQALLAEAVRRGPVTEFARVVPTLSEIYREVSA